MCTLYKVRFTEKMKMLLQLRQSNVGNRFYNRSIYVWDRSLGGLHLKKSGFDPVWRHNDFWFFNLRDFSAGGIFSNSYRPVRGRNDLSYKLARLLPTTNSVNKGGKSSYRAFNWFVNIMTYFKVLREPFQ